MMTSAPFCTCNNRSCHVHPSKHEHGCNPCIAKNLQNNVLPRCFFQKVAKDITQETDFSYKHFAELVIDNTNE